MYRWINVQMDKCIDRYIDGQMFRWINVQIDRYIDG